MYRPEMEGTMPATPAELLAKLVGFYRYRPTLYVEDMFPWGRKGTPLAHHTGPRKWQREFFEEVEQHALQMEQTDKTAWSTLRKAIASGRGVGKSSGFGMLSCWFMDCHPGASIRVTASTETQLRTITMPELKKWRALSLTSSHWEHSGLKVYPSKRYANIITQALSIDTSMHAVAGYPWSEENPDGFAGAHNAHGFMLLMDEASAIPRSIFSVATGFFTEVIKPRYWLCFSNPRRVDGAFFDTFANPLWRTSNLNGRDVEGVDQAVYDDIAATYGENSTEYRVEVLGQFPTSGSDSFFNAEELAKAITRTPPMDRTAPLILGVDVARFGEDQTVLRLRRGKDAQTIPPIKMSQANTMAVANRVAETITQYQPDAVFVDVGGVGGGVFDRLHQLGYRQVVPVDFGSSAGVEKHRFKNKRGAMYGALREWVYSGGCIDPDVADEARQIKYAYDSGTETAIKIESKKDMKKRGLRSPDELDALAITFAEPVAKRAWFPDEGKMGYDTATNTYDELGTGGY